VEVIKTIGAGDDDGKSGFDCIVWGWCSGIALGKDDWRVQKCAEHSAGSGGLDELSAGDFVHGYYSE
jgi:hypothetical protein